MFDPSNAEFADPPLPPDVAPFHHGVLWWLYGASLVAELIWLGSLAFWIWMAVHCYQHEEDRSFWLWIMVLFPPACLAYFVARWIPHSQSRGPGRIRRWFRGRELERLEMATLQIGNPYHFIQYGDALREVGQHDRARAAYVSALEKDPANVQALWGAALVEIQKKNLSTAAERLQQVLKIDPHYKFGDVSLAYARVLYEQGNRAEARQQLDRHMQRWRHPEAMYLLAELQASAGETQDARKTLQALLMDINACPGSLARQYGTWKSKARGLLKKLPAV